MCLSYFFPKNLHPTLSDLLKISQKMGLSHQGEIFSTSWLAQLSIHFGLDAQVYFWKSEGLGWSQIQTWLFSGAIVLIPYDKDVSI